MFKVMSMGLIYRLGDHLLGLRIDDYSSDTLKTHICRRFVQYQTFSLEFCAKPIATFIDSANWRTSISVNNDTDGVDLVERSK